MEDHEDSRSIVLDEAMRWPPPASIPGSFGSVVLGLRPEAVVPTRADDRPKGEVVKVSWVGTTNLVTVRVGRRDVHCLAQPDETWKVGESVTPRIDYAKALWFDSGTGARLTV
jgi:ABC-type sugar transport system ATPase subunit